MSVALCVTLSGTGSPKGRRIKRRVVAALLPLLETSVAITVTTSDAEPIGLPDTRSKDASS